MKKNKIRFIIIFIFVTILLGISINIYSNQKITKLGRIEKTKIAAETQTSDIYVNVSTQADLVSAWENYDGSNNLHIVLQNDIVIDRVYTIQANWKIYFSSQGNNWYQIINNPTTGSTVFYVYQNGYLELQNVVVNGNGAPNNNATSCIRNTGTVSLKGAKIANSSGDGIYQEAGTLIFEKNYDSIICDSVADGIGIKNGNVYINSGEIYNNHNGITLEGGNLEINYGTIRDNTIYGINALTNFTVNGGYLLDKTYLGNDNIIITMNDVAPLNLKLNQYNDERNVVYSVNSGLIQSISDRLTIDGEGWEGKPNNQNYIAIYKKKLQAGVDLTNCNLSNIENITYGKDYSTELTATLSTTKTNTRKSIVSILGDSISTYEGSYKPYAGLGRSYYPWNDPPERNIYQDDTWWQQIINDKGMELGVNNSWGGTTVTNVKLSTVPENSCFLSDDRINSLDDNGTPDYIFVFGGMNDMLNMSTGTIQLGDFNDLTRTDTFAGAYYQLFMKLKSTYPNSIVVSLIPYHSLIDTTGYYDTFHKFMTAICDGVGVQYIDLHNIGIESDDFLVSTDKTHPNANGMDLITNAVEKYISMRNKITTISTYGDTSKTPYYTCPEDIEVKVGNTVLKNGEGYTYTLSNDKSTANIKINGSYINDTVTIKAKANAKQYDVDLIEDLQNCSLENKNTKAKYGEQYKNKIIVKEGYSLPETIEIVKENNTKVVNYNYNSSTGEFYINGGEVTGDLKIYATPNIKKYKINANLTNCVLSNTNDAIYKNEYNTILNVETNEYLLPNTIEISINGKILKNVEDYSYNNSNGNITIYSKNIIGNIEIKAKALLKSDFAPKVTVSYSKIEMTNQNVKVTIKSDKEIKSVQGWTISKDKKILTKEYSSNVKETVNIEDLLGNIVKTNIVINNIIKTPPVLNVIYSNKNFTTGSVIVTIKSNQKLNELNGWKISEDSYSLQKEYNQNAKEKIEVTDIAGNKSIAEININNIKKAGDFNSDGKIDELDIDEMHHILIKQKENISEEKKVALDMNNDGKITITDLLLMKQEKLNIKNNKVESSKKDSYSLKISKDIESSEKNEKMYIRVSLKDININNGEKGLGAYKGIIEYDRNVFNNVTVNGVDGWETPIIDKETGVFVATKTDAICTDEDTDIAVITLSVNKETKVENTEIKIKNFYASNGKEEIGTEDNSIQVNIADKIIKNEPKDNTIKNSILPNAGISLIIKLLIFIALISSAIAIIKYKNMKDVN